MKNLKRMIEFMLCCLLLPAIFTHPSARAATQAEIEAAITNGINWLAAQQEPNGCWYDDMSLNRGGTTGLAVLKLEDRAYELGYSSPFDPAYPYSQNVEDGLTYLFSEANSIIISNQPAGNPDTDGDGIGISIATDDWHSTYETGIAMMAIAASKTPNRIVNSPGSPVNGWTYKQVLQDMADYLAFGQCDSPNQSRGGWDYSHNTGWADNSNSGYAVLGLAYAEAAVYGFNCVIPVFVKNELSIWIDYIQNDVDGDIYDGGSGYTDPCDWVNILKTGNLIFEMTFYGDSAAIQRVQDAIDYLERTWNDPSSDPGWGNPNFYIGTPHYQAMYCVMKGLEYAGINTIYVGGSPTDWYAEFADAIVNTQQADGSWPIDEWGGTELSTDWALLTLEKTAPPEPEPKPLVEHLKWSQPPIEKYQPTALLYASSPGTGTSSLSTVDPFTGFVTIIGPFIGAEWDITEIEWSPDGSTLYGTTGGGASTIHTIDPTTGIILSTVVQIPPGTALQGLEFDASGTLLATSFPDVNLQSELVQVNPATGILTTIGPTDYNQIGGLAFDSGFNTLYGITSGRMIPPILLSVNPSTGAATPIAVTTMNTEASSLEFTADGRLVTSGGDGNFYEIDPTNGLATLIGPMINEPKLSGLSLRPTPVVYWGWDETSYNLDYNEFDYNDPWPHWKIVADDFRCLGSMPVGSIHWWGSHYGWEDTNELPPEPDLPEAWLISIWSNVPEGFEVPYSHPEELLWQIEVDANRVAVNQVGTDEFCTVYPNDVSYQYYLDLEPREYFWQQEFEPNTIDDIFWLSIAAIYPSEGNDLYELVEHPWGWKTRPWSWMDDAVTIELDSKPVLGPRMERVVDYIREEGDPLTVWSGFRALYIWNDIMHIGDYGMDLFGRYDGMTFTYDADLGGSCIYDFEVYDSELYACAFVGNVHKSSDGTTWTTIRGDQPDHSWELEAFSGYLYVSTGPNLERYDGATFTLVWTEPSGYEIISMLNDGSNLIIGVGDEAGYGGMGGVGKVYSYDGMTVDLISGIMGDGIQSLLESGGVLYAGGSNPGVVYEYLGGNLWQVISPTLGNAVLSLCEFEGDLYAGTMNGGKVWRYDGGTNWTQIGGEIDDQVCSLIVYQDSLYAGTAMRAGRLYRYDPDAPNPILDPCSITPIKDPVYYESFDVAFELDTDPDYIKWEQPFTGIRDWPHYWDEPSMAFGTGEPSTKYVQWPDPNPTGMDVLAGPLSVDETMEDVYEVFLADDFICTSTGLITDIHIWASYNEDIVLTDTPWFSLVIYENVPADEFAPYSRPGAPLWDVYMQPSSQWIDGYAEEYFYDPYRSIMGTDTQVWRFNFEIDPAEAFVQEEGEIYWLGVHHSFDLNGDGIVSAADVLTLVSVWPSVFGWKTSIDHFEDAAVFTGVMTYMSDPHVIPSGEVWIPLFYPLGHPFEGESIDMAFEITTQESELEILRLVADDWKCERRTPVTALAWWGSYLGYEYNAGHIEEVPPPMDLPVKPDFFRLNIWTDVPEDPNVPFDYSHPRDIIWQYDAYDYDEVLVGFDKQHEGDPREAVFRYSVRLPEDEWFRQPMVDGIYWLSIVAVYDTNMPNYDWGWTNHEHVFNDDAVEGFFDLPFGWFWYELYDQTEKSEDMSFILFTDPNECDSCADYNLDDIVNFFDYAIFSLDWMWVGPVGGYANGDLNCNGKVDFEDVEIFCLQWLDSCP